MIGFGYTEDQISDLIDMSYGLRASRDGSKKLSLEMELSNFSGEDLTGKKNDYRFGTFIGKSYKEKNPNEELSNQQEIRKFVLYCLGIHGSELVFVERTHSFQVLASHPGKPDKPSDSQLRAKAREFLAEGLGTFSRVKDPLDIKWDGPCVLGFVLCDPHCRFLRKNGLANSIHFPDGVDLKGKRRRANKSFGFSRLVRLRNNEDMLIVENHHLFADDGEPRPNGTGPERDDYYKFDLYTLVEFDNPSVELPVIIDPSGRNVGP